MLTLTRGYCNNMKRQKQLSLLDCYSKKVKPACECAEVDTIMETTLSDQAAAIATAQASNSDVHVESIMDSDSEESQETSVLSEYQTVDNTVTVVQDDDEMNDDEISVDEVEDQHDHEENSQETLAAAATASDGNDTNKAPTDIASSPLETPKQPVIKFPQRAFGTGRKRGFNVEWYKRYPWLEYSIQRDAAYCYSCRLFTARQHHSRDSTFSIIGFRNWKHAMGKKGFLKVTTIVLLIRIQYFHGSSIPPTSERRQQ